MKSWRSMKTVAAVSACAFALAMSVGCGSGSSTDTTEATTAADEQTEAQTTDDQQVEAQSTEGQQVTTEGSAAMTAEEAVAEGYQVFEGTVRVLSAQELYDLQETDIEPAAVVSGGDYAVLVFDAESEVTGMYADGSGERKGTATMLCIAEYTDYESFVVEYGDLESWKEYDGQHVKLAAKVEDIVFPSDVRLPIGEPSAAAVIMVQ